MKFVMLLLFPLLAMSYEGHDNLRGQKISACLKTLTKQAPHYSEQKIQEVLGNKSFKCQELHFFWDDNWQMSLFSHNRGREFPPVFAFELRNENHHGMDEVNLYEVKTHKNKYVSVFSHAYLAGAVTESDYGMPPHIRYFFAPLGNKTFVFEKFVKTWQDPSNPMTNYWPAIANHPMAVYGDYPTRPDTWVYKIVGQGLCFEESALEADKDRCF